MASVTVPRGGGGVGQRIGESESLAGLQGPGHDAAEVVVEGLGVSQPL